MKLKESAIQSLIIDYLRLHQVFCWRQHQTGIYDVKRRVFRKLNGNGARRGISDILGVHESKFFAIEVKSEDGIATEDQLKFIQEVNANGGIAFVARNIVDVQKGLSL